MKPLSELRSDYSITTAQLTTQLINSIRKRKDELRVLMESARDVDSSGAINRLKWEHEDHQLTWEEIRLQNSRPPQDKPLDMKLPMYFL